jgi:hypothetical protein
MTLAQGKPSAQEQPAARVRDPAAVDAVIAALAAEFGNRLVTSTRQHDDLDRKRSARRGGVSADHR